MNCIQPGATSPEDLMACADGSASPAIDEHVQRCSGCAEEVAAYTRAQRRLRQTFHRMGCPPAEAVGDYDRGLLSEAERVAMAGHIRDCPRCTAELETLRAFLRAESDAPSSGIGVLQRLVRVVALAVAPPLQQAAAALRGSVDDANFTYRAGSQTIKISQTPEGRGRTTTVMGLVWDNDSPDVDLQGEARLVAIGDGHAVSPIDSLGNFAFERVSSGMYQLEIQTQQQIAVVENLRIGG